MSQRCELNLSKSVMSGHKVSHSNHKTKTKFSINLQSFSLKSEILNEEVRVKATVHSMRSVEHNGGLDSYLCNVKDALLPNKLQRLKKRIKKAMGKKAVDTTGAAD